MLNSVEALPEFVSTGANILLGAIVAAQVGLLALAASGFRSTKLLEIKNSFSPEQAKNIAEYAEQTVDYIHSNNIGSVALLDTAARPFAHPISMAWQRRFGDDPGAPERPSLFFINPQGFVARSNFNPLTLLNSLLKPVIKGDTFELPHRRRSAQSIQTELPNQLPGFYARRDQPTLVLDTCLHTGSTITPLIKGLQAAGFDKLHLGVIHCKDSKLHVKPDLILDANPPVGACYPFGIDKLVEKTYRRAHSNVTNRAKRKVAGIQLRTNLHNALISHYNAPAEE